MKWVSAGAGAIILMSPVMYYSFMNNYGDSRVP